MGGGGQPPSWCPHLTQALNCLACSWQSSLTTVRIYRPQTEPFLRARGWVNPSQRNLSSFPFCSVHAIPLSIWGENPYLPADMKKHDEMMFSLKSGASMALFLPRDGLVHRRTPMDHSKWTPHPSTCERELRGEYWCYKRFFYLTSSHNLRSIQIESFPRSLETRFKF